jgi:hypothetical protein
MIRDKRINRNNVTERKWTALETTISERGYLEEKPLHGYFEHFTILTVNSSKEYLMKKRQSSSSETNLYVDCKA